MATILTPKQRAKNDIREWARKNDRNLFVQIQKRGMHEAFWHLIEPAHTDFGKRFNFFRGGRGGMRTTSLARCFVDWMADSPVRLCAARSFQNSIAESNKQAIEDQISILGLDHRFEVTDYRIESDIGATCVFKGLERNPDSFKSFEALDALWWEEANAATRGTLLKVTPTLRKRGSRLIFSYNPEDSDAPIENEQKINKDHALGCVIRHTNYLDNPWCSPELKADAEALKAHDYERYQHVFKGAFWAASEASILGKRIKVRSFEVDATFGDPLIGVDWGFSNDPTAVTVSYVVGRTLYIRRAAGKVKLELDDTADWLIDHAPEIQKYRSFADSARPETISKVAKKIPLIVGVEKGKGSVEDGVVYLQDFEEIVIHPNCQADTASEMKAYCFKVDTNGNPTKVIVDANNHYADSLRYGHSQRIKSKGRSLWEL